MKGPSARRETDENGADHSQDRVFVPAQVPFWFRPWVEMFKAFGFPVTVCAYLLLQNAGVIPSESKATRELLLEHHRAAQSASQSRLEIDSRRIEIDKLQVEALTLLRQEVRKNNRISRAVCAEWGQRPDIRRACLEE